LKGHKKKLKIVSKLYQPIFIWCLFLLNFYNFFRGGGEWVEDRETEDENIDHWL
jgi:hypothetical protein